MAGAVGTTLITVTAGAILPGAGIPDGAGAVVPRTMAGVIRIGVRVIIRRIIPVRLISILPTDAAVSAHGVVRDAVLRPYRQVAIAEEEALLQTGPVP